MSGPVDRWRVAPGERPDLSAIDTSSKKGAPGDKKETRAITEEMVSQLAEMQGRLWAEQERSLLLVLQAMDGGGKDGTIRKVFTGVNPQGVSVAAFKVPSEEERAHDFLWRVHSRVPAAGHIGVFNRSHYEDVLVVRVEDLVPEKVWRRRYDAIREFEELLTEGGTTVVKIFLHISKDEQAARFRDRLSDPAKRWKFALGDLDVRKKWDQYQEAYADALGETSTADCPWYVIPADHKWYRDWAVLEVLLETLRKMDPQYPPDDPSLADVVVT